jgi:hypothetical protein
MKTEIWIIYRLFDYEKTLNYKIIDLVESYNIHIKFIFIRVQTKKNINFWKQTRPLPPWPTTVEVATVPHVYLTPWGTAVGPFRRPPQR